MGETARVLKLEAFLSDGGHGVRTLEPQTPAASQPRPVVQVTSPPTEQPTSGPPTLNDPRDPL
jgi:hypothetical protein